MTQTLAIVKVSEPCKCSSLFSMRDLDDTNFRHSYPGNRGRKSLLFGSCLSTLFPSIRHRNFHHSCKICPLSFDLVKKKMRVSCFQVDNFPFKNETPFYFGIEFLENYQTDCNQNLPSQFSS